MLEQQLRPVTLANNCREAIASFLTRAQCDGSSAAVLEASRNWPVMYDWLEEVVNEVHLAHPLKVKAIAEAKIKTEIDAIKPVVPGCLHVALVDADNIGCCTPEGEWGACNLGRI